MRRAFFSKRNLKIRNDLMARALLVHPGVYDSRLEDRVADYATFRATTESDSLIAGRDLEVVTDIPAAPNGNLLVVSLDIGTVFEVFGRSEVLGGWSARAKGERT